MPLQPGEIIDGKYRIVCLLGEGGMGAVYEGENTRIKRRVAIKVLHAAVAEKADVVQRFEREAQAAGRIGSDHIVEVLDLGNLPSGERFMVMEYLDGQDLTTRIKWKKRLTALECVPLIDELLEGLAAAHDAQIIHRDLKPDNIYVLKKHAGRTDFVKILDFGVSKFSALDQEMSMTRTGAVMGTPFYMSPEQAKGAKLDHRTDLYAIGVILYQMVTGRVPFNAGSFNELLFKIALETPEPIETIVPGIDTRFVELITRAMQRDPAARFQTARDFQVAVRQFAEIAQGQAQGQVAATQALPQMGSTKPGMGMGQTATPPHGHQSNPALGSTPGLGSAAVATGSYPGNIPGTNTPVGPLGLSQQAMAVTPTPSNKRGGMMAALAAVGVAIVAAGLFGVYMLTRPAPTETGGVATQPTTPTATQTATPTAAPEDDPEPDDPPPESDVEPDSSADPVGSTTTEPTQTAAPIPTPTKRVVIAKPKPTSKPKPEPTSQPKDPAKPKPKKKPGREVAPVL